MALQQVLVEDEELQLLLLNTYDAQSIYNEQISLLVAHLPANIFYNTLEKYIRNEEKFKEEIRKSLCKRDATLLTLFNKDKYSRSEEHKEMKDAVKKINRRINKIWTDCGEEMYGKDEFDKMNRLLNPSRFRTSSSRPITPSTPITPPTPTAGGGSSRKSIEPIAYDMDGMDDLNEEFGELVVEETLTNQQMAEIEQLKQQMKAIDFSTTDNVNVFKLIPNSMKEVPRSNPNYPSQHMYPKIPFVELIVGQTGSGKTGYLTQMLARFQEGKTPTFDKIYLLRPAGAPIEPVYQTFSAVYGIINIEGVENIPYVDAYDASLNILVILDDLIKAKSPIITDYFTRGRKVFSMFFLTQSYFETDIYYRAQCFRLCIFSAGITESRKKRLLKEIGGGLELSVLEKVWEEGTNTLNLPIVIDVLNPDNEKKFRKGFEREFISPSKYSAAGTPTAKVNSTKVTPATTPKVNHQKINNQEDFDNVSDITTQSYANPKTPATKPREPKPSKDVEQDNSTFITIEQDNKVYLKDVESNKVFELSEIGYYDEITNTIRFNRVEPSQAPEPKQLTKEEEKRLKELTEHLQLMDKYRAKGISMDEDLRCEFEGEVRNLKMIGGNL
jgi:hypothetical protein